MTKKQLFILAAALFCGVLHAQKSYVLTSPDGKLKATVQVGKTITYSLQHQLDAVIAPSPISMTLSDGRTWGADSRVKTAKRTTVNTTIPSPFYKKQEVTDSYNQLELIFNKNFKLQFRAYNEAMAYRFSDTGKQPFNVVSEEATFHFDGDRSAYFPYVKTGTDITSQFFNSFENIYQYGKLTAMDTTRLVFTPIVVEVSNTGKKLCIAEADVESYPGMFLLNKDASTTLNGLFAPLPQKTIVGGHNDLQKVPQTYHNYLAACQAGRSFPWRIAIVTEKDTQLADNDIVYRLASPSRLEDISWIKPGKVAWEWWNHWGVYDVDFQAGVNNKTYMAYIDFASRHGIEYVILDEGWAVNMKADLFQVVPEIDLKELAAYAKSKNVDLILWAGYYAFDRDMEKVCKHYSAMGVKGFKVDFMDRDDQEMVDFHYRAAEMAAKYHLMLDFHGTYKPTGLNRTYPNVVNFEAVHGLEQMKWSDVSVDQVTYDVTMPFIRMVAGPVDYTQGAMRNAQKPSFKDIDETPMSQGTRCRQLAEYVIFESPLNMLCDTPNLYEEEEECTEFISQIPTVWDSTVSMDGKIGHYIAMARRKGNVWYVGTLTNWDRRSLKLDLSFLGEGDYKAEIFKDGANANDLGFDYKKEIIDIPANRQLNISMAQGGGYAMKIYLENEK